MKPEKKCSICNEVIFPTKYWNGTHNAYPVNDGVCCRDCDINVVIPARLKAYMSKWLIDNKYLEKGE